MHAPYTLQSAISAERQLTKSATLSVTYLNSRGFDQLLTINANAPFPGTPGSTARPQPDEGNIYRYVSEGNFKQNQLIVNSNMRLGTKVQVFGFYTLNYANSNTSGVSSFPQIPTTSVRTTAGHPSTRVTAFFLAAPLPCPMRFASARS